MKDNSYFNLNFIQNSIFWEDAFLSGNVFGRSIQDVPSGESKRDDTKTSNFLLNLWDKLINKPFTFPHHPNSSITNILLEDTGFLANEATSSVLSKILKLPINSTELIKAIEESTKIYHEDFPFDFVLELNGERLGMFMLDKCFDQNGKMTLIYRFNSDLKNFKGLF